MDPLKRLGKALGMGGTTRRKTRKTSPAEKREKAKALLAKDKAKKTDVPRAEKVLDEAREELVKARAMQSASPGNENRARVLAAQADVDDARAALKVAKAVARGK